MDKTFYSKRFLKISITLFVFVSCMLLPCNYCIQASDTGITVLWKSLYTSHISINDDIVLSWKINSFIALEAETGKPIWKKPVELKGEPQVTLSNELLITLKDSYLLVSTYSFDTTHDHISYIYCINIRSGDVLWTKEIDSISLNNQWIIKDHFYYANLITINKIDIKTGNLIESNDISNLVYNHCSYKSFDEQYLLVTNLWVTCIDLKSRRIVWDTNQNWYDVTKGCADCDYPLRFHNNLQMHKDNVIYIDHDKLDNNEYNTLSVYCRQVKTGQLVWKFIDPLWNRIYLDSDDFTIIDDIVIQTYTRIDGKIKFKKHVVAIDANTGKELWRKTYDTIKYPSYLTSNIKYSTFAGNHNNTFVFSNFISEKESELIALDVKTGEERWRMGNFQTLDLGHGKLSYNGEIVFLDGVAYATPDYIEKPQEQNILWQSYYKKPFVLNDNTFVLFNQVDNKYNLEILRVNQSGKPLWRKPYYLNGIFVGICDNHKPLVTGNNLIFTAYTEDSISKITGLHDFENVFFIDMDTGIQGWMKETKSHAVMSYWIIDSYYYYTNYKSIIKLDVDTGKEVDHYIIDDLINGPDLFKAFNNQYVFTAEYWLSCVDLITKKIVWDTRENWEQTGADHHTELGDFRGNIQFYKDSVIFYDHDKDSKSEYSLFCRNVYDGNIVWKIPDIGNNRDIILINDMVIISYTIGENKIVESIDAGTGNVIWINNFKSQNLKELYNKEIRFSNFNDFHDNTYVFNNITSEEESDLIALDVKTGEQRWRMGNFQTLEMGEIAYNGEIVFLDSVAYATPDYAEKTPVEPTRPIVVKYQVDNNSYWIGEEEYKMYASPTIIDYRAYLPAKYLVEPLGGDVEYIDNVKKVTCKLAYPGWMDSHDQYKENVIELYIGKPITFVNGKERQIDPNNPKITPIILNGRTMVPVRFLAESLGCEVKWIAENKAIIIRFQP